MDKIVIRGARQHNLKNVNIDIPRDKLVVITGLSGSGKSSLVFDTIYAEGQRRYVESLSTYARQFLGQMDKPDIDYIGGLSPAIAIDQKSAGRNPRSTVGTVTEIYDYFRLLYARLGHVHCPKCKQKITRQTVDQIVDSIKTTGNDAEKLIIMAPIIRGKKGEHQKLLTEIQKEGFLRVRINGKMHELDIPIELDRNKRHNIEVIVDRLILRHGIESRLNESIETALRLGNGIMSILHENGQESMYSENFACIACGISLPDITPRLFSFNSPYGACPACSGLGFRLEIDRELLIPYPDKSFAAGAIAPLSKDLNSYYLRLLEAMLISRGFNLNHNWSELTADLQEILLWGSGEQRYQFEYENLFGEFKRHHSLYEGLVPMLERRHRDTTSEWAREDIERYMVSKPCHTCHGARLKPEALAVTIGGKDIYQLSCLNANNCSDFFTKLQFNEREQFIGREIIKEINNRLNYLTNVGLNYISLDRTASTLSGGEAQRIRLATQIGSGLTGVLYILDEPSIGLHQRDNARLLSTLRKLRDLGNTLLVVEHDEETMLAADYLIDIGPLAGIGGGKIVAVGTATEIMSCKESITGQYLSGRISIPIPAERRPINDRFLTVIGAYENNLKNIDVMFPIGLFTAITGVSGSGKSTLVNEVLYKTLANRLSGKHNRNGNCKDIYGSEYIDKIIDINQSPIGRTPRSNPATYTGLFDSVREIFSLTPEARLRGYKPGRFSFNVRGGRCEACRGDGIIKIEMHFLPDVYVPCEVCYGSRYNRETLEVRYKGHSIAQVLEMTIDTAIEVFAHISKIERKLRVLKEVGLGYIKLGQPATTLSGGEAQRVKLATELARRSTGRTLYILDEPTTGLHSADIHRLLEVLQRLVDGGDTVLVIEHNLDVIKTADYIIDLGPEGGDNGGEVLAVGTPEQIASNIDSCTGKFLALALDRKFNHDSCLPGEKK